MNSHLAVKETDAGVTSLLVKGTHSYDPQNRSTVLHLSTAPAPRVDPVVPEYQFLWKSFEGACLDVVYSRGLSLNMGGYRSNVHTCVRLDCTWVIIVRCVSTVI